MSKVLVESLFSLITVFIIFGGFDPWCIDQDFGGYALVIIRAFPSTQ